MWGRGGPLYLWGFRDRVGCYEFPICDGVGCYEFPFFKLLVRNYAQWNSMLCVGVVLGVLVVFYRFYCFGPFETLLIFVSSVHTPTSLFQLLYSGLK